MSKPISNTKHELQPELWVDAHGDYLYNFAWLRVQSKETAEDIVQEIFISYAIRQADRISEKENLRLHLIREQRKRLEKKMKE